MQKQDMSATCGFRDVELYYKLKDGEITQEEYDEYWNNNCGKCVHMVKICMYGEGEDVIHKDTHVYCTNCEYFKLNFRELPYCPYECDCDLWDCNDSKPLKERPMYEER